MKDFEKRIIELCKTTNVEKVLTITGIALAIITLLGTSMEFPRIINVLIALVVLAIIIIIRIVRKIKKTDIETFSKNNFWYVIFSDSNVSEEICFITTMLLFYSIPRKIKITTGSLFWDIIVALVIVAIVFLMSDNIAKFFKSKLK
mgnify:FL=1